MKSKCIINLIIMILSLNIIGFGQNKETISSSREFGKINAPKYKFIDINNLVQNWKMNEGKIVIIEFWTTWCEPCHKGIPELIAIKEKYGDNLKIIGLSFDKSTEIVNKYLKNDEIGKTIKYPIIFGKDFSLYFDPITIVPTKLIMDKEGYIRYELKGYTNKSEIESYIDKLLMEK
jgi:thiol-disulfide isomerase/thioredoxin